MSSLDQTEARAAAGAIAPRVSLDDIKNAVSDIFFLQGESLFFGLGHSSLYNNGGNPAPYRSVKSLELLTLCLVVMKNGFTIVGKSAPASPENFDAQKGKDFAFEDALRQAWPLMGYALRDRLTAQ